VYPFFLIRLAHVVLFDPISVSREVNGAKFLGFSRACMNRQQVIAVIFTVLMVGSMVAWGATLI